MPEVKRGLPHAGAGYPFDVVQARTLESGEREMAEKKEKAETTFHKGDKVEWDASQGTIEGTVEKKLTQPMTIKTHKVEASPDNPEYLVKSDKTGAEAAHKPDELRKK